MNMENSGRKKTDKCVLPSCKLIQSYKGADSHFKYWGVVKEQCVSVVLLE